MEQWLIAFVAQHSVIVYGLFAILSSIEGPVLAMIGGVLLHLGYLYFIPLYLSLMIGDLLGDTLWYLFGRYLGARFVKRFGKYFSLSERHINIVKKIFHKYHSRILIISKITMGFGFAIVTLFTAGMIKIPFRKYIILNAIGQFVWTGFLLFIGYSFGHIYENINGILGKMSLIAMFIIAFVAMLGYGQYIKRRMFKVTENV